MKTAVSITGYFSLSLIIVGSLFKIQHWPGAGPFIILGTSIFASIFMVFYFIHRIMNRQGLVDVLEAVFFCFAVSVFTIGMLFKVLHWPGAGPMLIAGMGAFAAIYLPIAFVRFYKEKQYQSGMMILHLLMGAAAISMTLAIGTPREVLHGYVNANHILLANNHSMQAVNQNMYSLAIQSEENRDRAEQIKERSAAMYKLIHAYKNQVVLYTEGYIAQPDDQVPVHLADSLYLLDNMMAIDNYDKPTYLLIGSDEFNPKTGDWSALDLLEEYNRFRDELTGMVQTNAARNSIAQALTLETASRLSFGDPVMSSFFYHMPAASVVLTLNSMKSAVLTAEMIALQELVEADAADEAEVVE